MTNNLNELTIVVPTYNRKNLLKECLDSIDNQSYDGFQLIISDNASSDGTEEFLKKRYLNRKNVVINRNTQNIGLVKNINKALRLVKTRWVTIVSDDDYLEPDFVLKLCPVLESTDKCLVAVSHRVVDENKNIIAEHQLPHVDLDVEKTFEMLFAKPAFALLPVAGISSFVFNSKIIQENTINDYFMGFYSDTYLTIKSISSNGIITLEDILYNRRNWGGAESRRVLKSLKLLYGMYCANHDFKKDLWRTWNECKKSFAVENSKLEAKVKNYCFSNYLKELFMRRLLRRNC